MSTNQNLESSSSLIWLVSSREIRTRLTSKAWLITTLLLVVLVFGSSAAAKLIGNSSSATTVGVVAETEDSGQLLTALGKSFGAAIDVKTVTREDGTAQVESGDLAALIVPDGSALKAIVENNVDQKLAPVLTALAQQHALAQEITKLGGNPDLVSSEVSAATIAIEPISAPSEVDPAQIVAGYIAGILLFMALMTSGQLITTGVVEEKSSRVVEILLATIRPWQLMTGKVVGIGIVGLLQVGATVAAGVIGAKVFGLLDGSGLAIGSVAIWSLIWFLIGFISYAFVLAALASLVSRQEDVGSVTTPVMMLMVIPYIVGISIAPWDPTNSLVTTLSYIPFCSPMIMPIRVALDAVDTSGILIALAINLAIIPLLVWLSGKIYRNAVLHSGDRMRLKTALR